MQFDDPSHFPTDKGADDLSAETVVVLRRQSVADIIYHFANDPIFVRAVSLAPCGGLKPVFKPGDAEAGQSCLALPAQFVQDAVGGQRKFEFFKSSSSR